MTPKEYRQFNAFARVDGLWVGLVWVGSFACIVYGMTSSLTGLMGTIAAIVSPFYAGKRLMKYRDEVIGGSISFLRAMGYYISIFLYASLILALAQYVYFAFIDQGFMANTIDNIMSAPEAKKALDLYGFSQKDIDMSINLLRSINPLEFAINVLSNNIILGFILSIPAGLILKRQKPADPQQQ